MTAVATIPQENAPKVPAVVKLLDSASDRLTPLLPTGVTLDRVKSELFFAARKNPDLLSCTPESLVLGIAKVIQRDLVLGETIYLVPTNESFKDADGNWQKRKVAVVMNDFKGDIELVIKSGSARSIKLMPVFSDEEFDTWTDENGDHLMHRPSKDAASRADLIGAYGIANLGPRVPPIIKWMPLADIEVVRAKSKSWAKEPTCPAWYAVKTVGHAITKVLPKNPRLAKLLRDIEADLGLEDAPETLPAPTATAQLASGEQFSMETGEIHNAEEAA